MNIFFCEKFLQADQLIRNSYFCGQFFIQTVFTDGSFDNSFCGQFLQKVFAKCFCGQCFVDSVFADNFFGRRFWRRFL